MPEADDVSTDKIDQALSESQRLEREELKAQLARQVENDQRVVEALANKPAD